MAAVEGLLILVRHVAMLGVLAGALLGAGLYVAIVNGVLAALREFARVPLAPETVEHPLHRAIERTGMLLAATTLPIESIGLYSLFIAGPHKMARSIDSRSFPSFEEKLINLIIAVPAVRFRSVVPTGQGNVLTVVGTITAVIAAFAPVLPARAFGHGRGDGEGGQVNSPRCPPGRRLHAVPLAPALVFFAPRSRRPRSPEASRSRASWAGSWRPTAI